MDPDRLGLAPATTLPASLLYRFEKLALTAAELSAAEQAVDTDPSDARKAYGNYAKGHVRLFGLDISIENPKGSTRSGTDKAGNAWSITMACPYGYILGTVGRDKDHLDVFLGPDLDSELIHIVNQIDPATGRFDEHKLIFGATSLEQARQLYLANYQDGWKGCGSVRQMSLQDFRKWLQQDTTKPVKTAEDLCTVCLEPWSACLGRHGSRPCSCGSGKPRNRCDCPGGTPEPEKQAGVAIPVLGESPMKPMTSNPHFNDALTHAGTLLGVKDLTPKKKKKRRKRGEDATGILDRRNYGDLQQLQPGELISLFRQQHDSQRAGLHEDYRIGRPDTGLFSWATKKELPPPGKRIAFFRQPLHDFGYGSFEGQLKGYGAGTVRSKEKGQVLVTGAGPDKVEFTTANQRYPQRYTLLHPQQYGDKTWLLSNVTPQGPVDYNKVHMSSIPRDRVESALQQLPPGSSVQPKLDGAATLTKLLRNGVEVTSYRVGANGRPLVHTERIFHNRPKLEIPPELVNTVLKGELHGLQGATCDEAGGDAAAAENSTGETQQGGLPAEGAAGGSLSAGNPLPGRPAQRVIEPQDLGGLLNSTLANSIAEQQRRKIKLQVMLYGIQQYGNQAIDPNVVPYGERLAMIRKVLEHLPAEHFFTPQEATTPEAAVQLWREIEAGQHPLTREGVVIHPATGRPQKGKLTEDQDVHITGMFPGEGRLAGTHAGGFTYATAPGGPEVGRVGTGLTDRIRQDMLQHPEQYIGRVARVRSQGPFASGALRAPSFLALHEDYPQAGEKIACDLADLEEVGIVSSELNLL